MNAITARSNRHHATSTSTSLRHSRRKLRGQRFGVSHVVGNVIQRHRAFAMRMLLVRPIYRAEVRVKVVILLNGLAVQRLTAFACVGADGPGFEYRNGLVLFPAGLISHLVTSLLDRHLYSILRVLSEVHCGRDLLSKALGPWLRSWAITNADRARDCRWR